ncbi:SKP1-like protein 12 [Andrographis paniculata]|uniref:SKP1-like protein 12 n=1 Tax=Andrographis paniculata TaxID=175694 RepID=UPI0021E97B79|nr:SKP1-like protein 12 [Andrographis paniculata]
MAASSSNTNKADHSKTPPLTLRSSDGKEFEISRIVAQQSSTIMNLLDLKEESNTDVIPIPEVDGSTLEKLIELMSNHTEKSFKYLGVKERKEFYNDFFANLKIRDVLNFGLAANYLGVQVIFDEACQKMADMIKNKSVEWVRKVFEIKNDFTSEEEVDLKKENKWAYEGVDPEDGDDAI